MHFKIFSLFQQYMVFSLFSDTSIVFHRGRQRGMQLRICILACLLLKGVSKNAFLISLVKAFSEKMRVKRRELRRRFCILHFIDHRKCVRSL